MNGTQERKKYECARNVTVPIGIKEKIILLTQGKFALVDDCDYQDLQKYNWYAHREGNKWYAWRYDKEGPSKAVKMHRQIMCAPSDKEVDHIDSNGLNNTRINLRLCSRKENGRNQSPQKREGKTSHYKGVSWFKRRNKWRAYVNPKGEKFHALGYFESEDEAALAYNKAALKLFGEFTKINVIEKGQKMIFNKNELLKVLSMVKPGLAKREFIEQTTHVIFTGDEVATYNDQICLLYPYETDFQCSVSGDEFYKILASIKEDEVEITVDEKQVKIKSKKTKAGMSTIVGENAKVEQLIGKIKADTTVKRFWKPLPENFIEGVNLCTFSASRDMTEKDRCCVAVRGDTVVSTDGVRLSRFMLSDPLKEEMLIPIREALELVKYPVVDYGKSQGWLHFRTEDGVIFSCRMYLGTYKFDKILGFLRKPINEFVVPMEMQDVMRAAAVVAEGDVEIAKIVEVTIKDGQIVCRSEDKGKKWMEKTVDLEGYDLAPVTFYINPNFFVQILDKATTMFLMRRVDFPDEDYPDKAFFTTDTFQHIICLPA